MSEIKFKILSLDGGGVRGAFTAAFLAELERSLSIRVADHFDLFAGTSTGSIIAAALAMGEPAQRIEELYKARASAIFSPQRGSAPLWCRLMALGLRRRTPDLTPQWLRTSKYDPTPLRAALEGVLGDRTLEDAHRRLVVPAVDTVKGQTVVFKTPHLPGLFRDRRFRAVDVVMASCAAPSYFPHGSIESGSAYVDGGLWANNPSVVAFAEAIKIRRCDIEEGRDAPFAIEDIAVLSVGTGSGSFAGTAARDGRQGLAFWGTRFLEVSGSAQSQGTGFISQHLLGPDRHHRVDFHVPDKSWKLDAVDRLDALLHIGREKAAEWAQRLRSVYFSRSAPVATPWPAESRTESSSNIEAPVGSKVC